MKSLRLIVFLLLILGIVGFFVSNKKLVSPETGENQGGILDEIIPPHPLTIEHLRTTETPGSELIVEETLAPGSNYDRYRVSYESEGKTIYALLTIPQGTKPASGWPVILFNHGFIPPAEYRTTERYIAYTDAFSRNGYILLRSDYRGHGESEGVANGGYSNPGYTIDVLNALGAIKKHKDADPTRIGMWGHSMGGFITIRSMVARPDIKAGVIWAGVVASYPDLINNWRRPNTQPTPTGGARRWRQLLVDEFGEPNEQAPFWKSLSANAYLKDVSGPIQLHHGTADDSVPYAFSEKLHKQLQEAGKTSEFYGYPGDDHNIAANFSLAINRSVEFFDRYLKNVE